MERTLDDGHVKIDDAASTRGILEVGKLEQMTGVSLSADVLDAWATYVVPVNSDANIADRLIACLKSDHSEAHPLTEEVLAKNIKVCLPLVPGIVAEDTLALNQYLSLRHIGFDALPKYVQAFANRRITARYLGCRSKADSYLRQFTDFKKQNKSERARITKGIQAELSYRYAPDSVAEQNVVEALGFRGVTRWAQLRNTQRILTESQFSPRDPSTAELLEGSREDVGQFNPFADDYHGQAARQTWGELVTVFINGALVEDICRGIGSTLPDGIKLALAASSPTAGGFIGSVHFSNAMKLSDLLEGAESLMPESQLTGLYETAGGSEAFFDILERKIEKYQSKAIRTAKKQSYVDPGNKSTKKAAERLTSGQSFKDGVAEYLSRGLGLSEEESAASAKEFWALYKRDAITYGEIIQCTDTCQLSALYETGREHLRNPYGDKQLEPQQQPHSVNLEAPASEPQDALDTFKIRLANLSKRGWFDKWLGTISKVEKAQVTSRLARVEQGYLGDFSRVFSDAKFAELRFHSGSGLRIYFKFDADGDFIILGAGSKSTQQRDIAQIDLQSKPASTQTTSYEDYGSF